MIELDVWVRGTVHAVTHRIPDLTDDARGWREEDVDRLLREMLLALNREKHPGGEPPTIAMRGFNWIVSPYDDKGLVLHLETGIGSVSAGPFKGESDTLTALIARVVDGSGSTVH